MTIDYGGGGDLTVTLEGPFGNVGSSVKLAAITAPAADWKGAVSPYSQVVQVAGVSSNSKVDLQLDPGALEALRCREVSFTACNEAGVVTLYAIGHRPEEDLTFQATVTEVTA